MDEGYFIVRCVYMDEIFGMKLMKLMKYIVLMRSTDLLTINTTTENCFPLLVLRVTIVTRKLWDE